MEIQVHSDLASFWHSAKPLYESNPARHTTAISVAFREIFSPTKGLTPLSLTLHRGDATVGALMRTPPWFVLLSGVSLNDVPAAVQAWQTIDPELPGVMGPKSLAMAFARVWSENHGTQSSIQENLRLYELGELRRPAGPGRSRLATENDLPLLVEWKLAFADETNSYVTHTAEDVAASLRRSMVIGDGILLWELVDQPVSTALATTPQAKMSRIGPVYTPVQYRQHGYGSAVTAAASQWALDAGADKVVLYTDLSNPTSNSIYQKIGYQPLEDYVELAFS